MPDESEHWLLTAAVRTATLEWQPSYMTGACVDITASKKAMAALQATETCFQIAVAPSAILRYTVKHHF